MAPRLVDLGFRVDLVRFAFVFVVCAAVCQAACSEPALPPTAQSSAPPGTAQAGTLATKPVVATLDFSTGSGARGPAKIAKRPRAIYRDAYDAARRAITKDNASARLAEIAADVESEWSELDAPMPLSEAGVAPESDAETDGDSDSQLGAVGSSGVAAEDDTP